MSEPSKADHAGAIERPWKWHPKSADQEHNGSIYAEPREGHAYAIAMQPRYVSDKQWAADAPLIVTAVNSFAAAEQMAVALEAAQVAIRELRTNGAPTSFWDDIEVANNAALSSWHKATGWAGQ
jgi:hypothetical protein